MSFLLNSLSFELMFFSRILETSSNLDVSIWLTKFDVSTDLFVINLQLFNSTTNSERSCFRMQKKKKIRKNS